jgi:hypothetical protein
MINDRVHRDNRGPGHHDSLAGRQYYDIRGFLKVQLESCMSLTRRDETKGRLRAVSSPSSPPGPGPGPGPGLRASRPGALRASGWAAAPGPLPLRVPRGPAGAQPWPPSLHPSVPFSLSAKPVSFLIKDISITQYSVTVGVSAGASHVNSNQCRSSLGTGPVWTKSKNNGQSLRSPPGIRRFGWGRGCAVHDQSYGRHRFPQNCLLCLVVTLCSWRIFVVKLNQIRCAGPGLMLSCPQRAA